MNYIDNAEMNKIDESVQAELQQISESTETTPTITKIRVENTDNEVIPAVNRNDPCPCGSGKKYKQCHGK